MSSEYMVTCHTQKSIYIYSRDAGLIPRSGRYPVVGNNSPFHYSCLENSMDREALLDTIHQVIKESDMTESDNI